MSALPHADPGRGVFETMLVIAGRVVELDAHIGRLQASVEALYGEALRDSARTLIVDHAGEIERGKLRLTVIPAPGPPGPTGMDPETGSQRLRVEAEEVGSNTVFPGPENSASLRSHVVAGGLGEHKWADRDLLDRVAATSPGELPLLLDADGTVLEASRASVFVIREGRLATPVTDGRILPSIARQQAIEAAAAEGIEIGEERLTLTDLLDHEVFLTGSVRGIEPAGCLDGAALKPPGEISGRLAAGLRRRWRVPAGEPAAAVAAGPPGGPPGR
jgi:para-aminobenzoate synthetase/4-amino-4-deoxychorismate lyase